MFVRKWGANVLGTTVLQVLQCLRIVVQGHNFVFDQILHFSEYTTFFVIRFVFQLIGDSYIDRVHIFLICLEAASTFSGEDRDLFFKNSSFLRS